MATTADSRPFDTVSWLQEVLRERAIEIDEGKSPPRSCRSYGYGNVANMPDVRSVEVKPITDADIRAVAEFLRNDMGSGVSVADWHRAMSPPWNVEQPNHGFLMREGRRVVGAYLALYSERVIDGRPRRICNLGTWCVADEHRASGLRLQRSLLRQRGYTFTDLTPNPTVVALNGRLGFVTLNTARALIPNMPWPVRSRGVRVVDDPQKIDRLLAGRDQAIYRDHATTAAHHVVLSKGDQSCYVMFRRDLGRFKRFPYFASVLYVGNPDLFRDCAPHFYRYLLLRRGVPMTLAELRVVSHRPPRSVIMEGPTKMFLSQDLQAEQIDYLYSELTCFKSIGVWLIDTREGIGRSIRKVRRKGLTQPA
jgi:hypothetical protein